LKARASRAPQPEADVDPADQRDHRRTGRAGQDADGAEDEALIGVGNDRDRKPDHHQQDHGHWSQESECPDESKHLPSIREGLPPLMAGAWPSHPATSMA